jgi:hypothetical protein
MDPLKVFNDYLLTEPWRAPLLAGAIAGLIIFADVVIRLVKGDDDGQR